MIYPHIKAAHISHADIAKAFGYKNVKSFNHSSAHKRHMKGIEEVLKTVNEHATDVVVAAVDSNKKLIGKDLSFTFKI